MSISTLLSNQQLQYAVNNALNTYTVGQPIVFAGNLGDDDIATTYTATVNNHVVTMNLNVNNFVLTAQRAQESFFSVIPAGIPPPAKNISSFQYQLIDFDNAGTAYVGDQAVNIVITAGGIVIYLSSALTVGNKYFFGAANLTAINTPVESDIILQWFY
jgi:hypothetical protein